MLLRGHKHENEARREYEQHTITPKRVESRDNLLCDNLDKRIIVKMTCLVDKTEGEETSKRYEGSEKETGELCK